MNFIEITYTKIKYIIRTFPRIRRLSLFFYTRKQNGKKWWKIYAKSVERYVVYLWFVLRIARFNKRRTRNESLWHVFVILQDILEQFKFWCKLVLDVLWLKVQAYNTWNTKFWFKYPTELIWYHVHNCAIAESLTTCNFSGFWQNEYVF